MDTYVRTWNMTKHIPAKKKSSKISHFLQYRIKYHLFSIIVRQYLFSITGRDHNFEYMQRGHTFYKVWKQYKHYFHIFSLFLIQENGYSSRLQCISSKRVYRYTKWIKKRKKTQQIIYAAYILTLYYDDTVQHWAQRTLY